MPVHGYTYIFALGMVFAFLDAYSIGANDVANSFSTAVASKTITLKQAVIIALFAEFLGAFLLGKSTADTIRSGIANLNFYTNQPEILMLGMLCALIGSSTTVMTATKFGLPISTTHAIVGGIIGMSVAAAGWNSVYWGWDGFLKIAVSWFTSPIFAGILAALIYLSVKYIVLKSPNSFERGLQMFPVYVFLTCGIMISYIVFKGAPNLPKPESMPQWQLQACIWGSIGGAALLALYAWFFYVPWIRRVLIGNEDLKWYHVFWAPWVPTRPQRKSAMTPWGQETYAKDQAAAAAAGAIAASADVKDAAVSEATEKDIEAAIPVEVPVPAAHHAGTNNILEQALEEQMYANEGVEIPKKTDPTVWGKVKGVLLHGVNQEIADHEADKYAYLHDAAVTYESKTEELYSFLQVFTCTIASFSHGSNDVANAIGPLSVIYYIWETGGQCARVGKSTSVQLWILAYGGIAIDIGLATWGYNVMRTLGNHLTYHSPSRGFSMELGAALAVLTASFIGIPVSTTQCITGATTAVGLCNGTTKGLNWKLLAFCFASWFLTVPLSGTVAGCIMGVILNAPNWNAVPVIQP
ncbi:phosphate-repressible phosphate permease [Hyaloraphidium curvatum]|nr:phosphate-repressible phosphate permease [Hyaloraphidium curvatum]